MSKCLQSFLFWLIILWPFDFQHHSLLASKYVLFSVISQDKQCPLHALAISLGVCWRSSEEQDKSSRTRHSNSSQKTSADPVTPPPRMTISGSTVWTIFASPVPKWLINRVRSEGILRNFSIDEAFFLMLVTKVRYHFLIPRETRRWEPGRWDLMNQWWCYRSLPHIHWLYK